MDDLHRFTEHIRDLDHGVRALRPVAAAVGVPAPTDQEWYELLQRKLIAQLDLPPVLVVAVVGGTNIGKSVIFNHLAGEVASAATPLAAGTRHPVCLVPPAILDQADSSELDEKALLGRLFEPFELHRWHSADDPLRDTPENRLYWRVGGRMPGRLLLLDAPDVDSDAEVNWNRARAIRQSADVLLAVLTQQKYNDAAVKRFFRAAAEADKPIVVLFNQCDPVADAPYWPHWLDTFRRETGTQPELVYVVPYDRRAAQSLQLPFYRPGIESDPRGAALPPTGTQRVGGSAGETPVAPEESGETPVPPQPPLPRRADVRSDFGAMHFERIKIRTFRGALRRVLDERRGVVGYLAELRRASDRFAAAAAALSTTEMARLAWPTLPPRVVVGEIRRWWDSTRSPWSRQIHGFYRTLGRGLSWPMRALRESMAGPQADPLDAFQHRERDAVLLAVEKMLDELTRLAEVGNDTLRPRLKRLLGGHAREDLLRRVRQAHDELPAVDEDYRAFLRSELETWRRDNPRAVWVLQSLDHVWAVARPTITVALVVSSWGVAGGLVGQAGHAAGELATELAVTGGLTGGGEALVSSTSEGVGHAAARLFSRLQAKYAEQRASWLAQWLEDALLGELLAELRRGAEAPRHDAFTAVQRAIAQLDAYNAVE